MEDNTQLIETEKGVCGVLEYTKGDECWKISVNVINKKHREKKQCFDCNSFYSRQIAIDASIQQSPNSDHKKIVGNYCFKHALQMLTAINEGYSVNEEVRYKLSNTLREYEASIGYNER